MNDNITLPESLKVEVVAGCLLKKDDRYLLVQEMKPSAYGLWNLPAGHVDIGETIEEAAIREVNEETGYKVKLGEQIGIFHSSANKPVIHIYYATIIEGELQPLVNDILDAKWMLYEEIKSLNEQQKLRATWIWELFQKIGQEY